MWQKQGTSDLQGAEGSLHIALSLLEIDNNPVGQAVRARLAQLHPEPTHQTVHFLSLVSFLLGV